MLLAILFSPCAGLSGSAAGARSFSSSPHGDKISSDLLHAARRAGTEDRTRIEVIVQFNDEAASRQASLLSEVGTTALKEFPKLNARLLSLPLRAAEKLAARTEVRYVSLDRPVTSSGHITTTTGAEDIRVQTSTGLLGLPTTTTLDGSNIGIAVLDSGLDANHVSFRDNLGFTRISAADPTARHS
jgi:hypothetical protein